MPKSESREMYLKSIYEIADGEEPVAVSLIAKRMGVSPVSATEMVKRLEKHPNKLVLHSDNKEYSPIYLQGSDINSIRIIGKVIWTCREFR